MSFRKITPSLWLAALLISCAPAAGAPVVFPTYDPFVEANGSAQAPNSNITPATPTVVPTQTPSATPTRPPTPTRVPLNISPLIGIQSQLMEYSPTPDAARTLPTPRQDTEQHIVQPGDTLGSIAEQYNVSLQSLMEANNISDPDTLEVGTTLVIPASEVSPVAIVNSLKLIPDSEMVNGPATARFSVHKFLATQSGYIKTYSEEVKGITFNGADIIEAVAYNYSVNPRLLLALLEYQSGWVTNPTPVNVEYPMGYADPARAGLYRQTVWAANTLNRGYYLWKANALSTWVLADGQTIPIDPTINAGTSAIQYFFSQLDGYDAWQKDTGVGGLIVSYYVFFDNPFGYAIEPLIPAGLAQPEMSLPFAKGESWYFTGGPHGAWDYGSAWGALDFAPPDNPQDCSASAYWVTAIADGLVTRIGRGFAVQDLDNDGYEQTGWVVIYMHIAGGGRVGTGEYLFKDEKVGHPSCEGGVSNATHLHITRKYNGEWIAADGSLPFVLSGWVSSGTGSEYDGFLTRGGIAIEAIDGANPANLVAR